jgi:hypothetical protein
MRDLHDVILSYEGNDLYKDVLAPWIRENDYKNYWDELNIVKGISQEDNWKLYAFSRVLDLLTLNFQPNNGADESSWLGPKISITEYLDFIGLLGLEIKYQKDFNPFYCEVIEAKAGNENFKIETCLFPAIKLKNVIVKRSGVIITVNPKDFNIALINSAKTYWTYRRKNRRYQDLSHGWGHNSQWRTEIRIDIESNDRFIYNEHGTSSLNDVTEELIEKLRQQNLELDEAIELTKNRHFINCIKDDGDLFPYDFRFEESKSNA